MLYSWLANLVLIVHLGFVLFVALGGLTVLRWPRLAWVHLPAVIWGAWIELTLRICPLTPLENRLLALAGERGYDGGFLEHYLLRTLYPSGLARSDHLALGLGVMVLNLAVYALVLRRRRQSGSMT
jgi:hypothetical protein